VTGLAALTLLAALGGAAGLGGHERPSADGPVVSTPEEVRQAALEDMWRRRLIPPDQGQFGMDDLSLLQRMKRADEDAVAYLRSRPGGYKPWTITVQEAGKPRILLTKEGFERYRASITQDAIKFFEAKGGDAKWVLKYTDWDGKRMFDGAGRITEAGEKVYLRARLNLEVFWKAPSGEAFGTRRPPAPGAPAPVKK
jgi:hypothetical protein